MPDQTFFDQNTRIDNLVAEFIQVQKQMSNALLQQSEIFTNLVASGLQKGTINVIQKQLPSSQMNELLYDYRNDRYFEKIGVFVDSKQYLIPQQTYSFIVPNQSDVVELFGENKENIALNSVTIQGISADAIQAGAILFRNIMSEMGMGYSFIFARNLNPYNNIIYAGIVAGQGRSVHHPLPEPWMFQWRLNDTLHIHFRNLNAADQTIQLNLEYFKLKEYEG